MSKNYDVIVLGAGSTGEVAAGRIAAAGLSTVIIEPALAGGECSYYACMPSKAMLRPTAVLNQARRLPGAREAVTGELDIKAVLAERSETVSHYDDSSQAQWLESAKVDLLRGRGRLTGEKTVTVELTNGGTEELVANRAVLIATGSEPTIPPVPGLADMKPWTNKEATSADNAPRRLAIIGGGYVATEMAQAWKALGCETVVMLVRGSTLLERAEPFAADVVAQANADLGIDVRFSTEAKRVSRENNVVSLELSDGSTLEVDEVLVAAGRKPTVKGIGLDSIGLPEDRAIEVDDQLRATGIGGEWLYACGDVNGRAPLTHMGKYEARLAADAITGKSVRTDAEPNGIPSVVFTDPQVAHVGMTLKEAQDVKLDVREVKVPLSSAAAAYINKEDGTAQIVVDESREVIVGATFVGPEVGELLHAATIAIIGEVPLDRLWHAVPSYPTVSEVWLRLLEEYGL